MRLRCNPFEGAKSRLSPFFFFFFVKPRDSKAHLHTHEKSSHKHIRTAHSSNLNLASGNLGTLRFLTFIRTRKRATKWTKTKTKRGNQNKCFYQGPSLKGLTHTHTHTHTLPVPDPHVTSLTFQHLKMQSRRLFSHWNLSVCVCVRIPLRLSPPSLDKNYIIAVCDLIFLKEHFEVSSFALFVSFPTFFFKVKMTHIKSLSAPCYAMLQHISSLSNVRGKSQF